MIEKKTGFPDEGDLVKCTITSVQSHSVFVRIEEYGTNGMIHISEVAPGRIRNMRDFVVEGKSVTSHAGRLAGNPDCFRRHHLDVSGKLQRGGGFRVKRKTLIAGQVLIIGLEQAPLSYDHQRILGF